MDLVTGGSGFIGTHLVKELLRRGREVRVYDLRPFSAGDCGWAPTDFVQADILDSDSLHQAMRGCRNVFHLAAIPHLWSRDSRIFDRVNRQGTETVVRVAKSSAIERFIYTGTESVLVPRNPMGPVGEDAQPVLREMIGPYCRSKCLAEQAVFGALRKGLNGIVVSPTLPLGPGDHSLTPPSRMILSFLQGKLPAFLDCALNFVDVRDAAVGHLLACEKGKVGQRYLLAGHNVTLAEFFRKLSRISGCPAPRFQVPYAVALGWSYVEEFFGKVTGRVPLSSVTGVRLCRRSLIFDGGNSWRELGHQPRPLEESLSEAVAWFRKRDGW